MAKRQDIRRTGALLAAMWWKVDAAIGAFGNWIERRTLRQIGVVAPLAISAIGTGLVALTARHRDELAGAGKVEEVVATFDGMIVARC